MLFVRHTSYTTNTREPNEDDQWDRGDSYTDHHVTGISLSFGQSEVIGPDDVRVGETVYLVYAVYTSGDSFGTDYAANIDFVAVFRNQALADAVKRDIEKSDGKKSSIKVRLDDGRTFVYGFPWLGYFDSLCYVNVEKFVVSK
jgi:hypothetical protein